MEFTKENEFARGNFLDLQKFRTLNEECNISADVCIFHRKSCAFLLKFSNNSAPTAENNERSTLYS